MQLYQANRDLSVASIRQLIEDQWSKLSTEAYDDYKRRADLANQMNEHKCKGRVYFRRTNGEVLAAADGLRGYVGHSDLLSISTKLVLFDFDEESTGFD